METGQRLGRRVLAVGAGMVLIGSLSAGTAFAHSDDDHYYYVYDYDAVCTDYTYSWHYNHDRGDWKPPRDHEVPPKDDEDEEPVIPDIPLPEIPEVPDPEVPDIPELPIQDEDETDPPDENEQTTLEQQTVEVPDVEDTAPQTPAVPEITGSDLESTTPLVETDVDQKAAVRSLSGTDPDEGGHDTGSWSWDDWGWSDHHTVTSVSCYENKTKGHRWYEHRPVGKVEATKVKTVPKGSVDTGS